MKRNGWLGSVYKVKSRLSQQTALRLKRLALSLCALIALVVGLTVQLDWQQVVLNAQETSPQAVPGVESTPTPSRRVVNEIVHPGSGDAIAGSTSIIGTPLIQNFARYDVHIAPSGSEDWRWLVSEYKVVRDDLIYRLDTTQLADGPYDIRVRAINNDGNYDETFLRQLEVRNARPPTPTPLFNALGTRVFVVPAQTPTPIPTPTPVNEMRSSGQQGFFSPVSGQVIQGYTPILASVFGYPRTPFARYELAISGAGLEQWTLLESSENQHWQDEIYLLNSYVLADGAYDLRLRNVYRDANFDEYFVRNLQIANDRQLRITTPGEQANGFTRPQVGQTIGGTVAFQGTAIHPDFLRWELYWSPTGGAAWSYLAAGDEEVLRGPLAQLDLSLLPPGGYDFMLRVVRSDYNYDDYFVRNLQVIPPTPTPFRVATLTPAPTP